MKISNHTWKLSDFLTCRVKIEAQPVYQRGPVWSEPKQRLLIDSIIRGLDIPKIYLHRLLNNPIYDYQIVDGQQRLTAIWTFADDTLTLALPDDLSDVSWADREASTLTKKDREVFENFQIVVAIVEQADDDHIRDLFSRLQMGEHLTPPEIRNSLRSVIGNEIRNVAENHRFFRNCSFSSVRFKHHDLAAHVFAVELFKTERDMKAANLRAMYVEYSDTVRSSLTTRVAAILDRLDDVQQAIPGWIDRKWGLVDLYLCLSQSPQCRKADTKEIADKYKSFEARRRQKLKRPESLLRGNSRDKRLYRYIKAFQMGGGLSQNLLVRHEVLLPELIG